MAKPNKNRNLNNPNSNPAHAPLTVTCSVHFSITGSVPKEKLSEWLQSLPSQAKVKFVNIYHGNAQFDATWTEER